MDTRAAQAGGSDLPFPPDALSRGYGLFAGALLGAAVWTTAILDNWNNLQIRTEVLNAGGINILVGLGMALSGLLLIAHRNPRSLGWLLLAGGTGRVLADAVPAAASADNITSRAVLTASVILVAGSVAAYYLALYALPLFLPGGRLTSRGTAAGVAVLAGLSAVQAVRDTVLAGDWYTITTLPAGIVAEVNNLDPERYPLVIWTPAVVAGASLTIMAVRWWRSAARGTPSMPVLTPYLLVPYFLWLGMCVFGPLLYKLSLSWWVTDCIWYAVAAIWPTVVGYAAARDRDRHLDRSARRVLSGFVLAAAVLAGYLALTTLLYLVLPPSRAALPLTLAGAGFALGALLQPTARWSAHVVDRYYYGKRAKPYQTIHALDEQLSKATDPADAPSALCDTAVDVLGLPGARLVAPAPGGGIHELASAGTCALDSGNRFPLTHHGAVIAHLLVAPRPGEQTLDRQDTEAVKILAAFATPAVAFLRVHEDLQHAHEELLAVREEERRRLRHELHDGLGPALSGLRLQIDVVRGSCPDQLAVILRDASAYLGQAVDDLRRITHGLAPAALDRHDLATALRQLAEPLAGPALRIDVALTPQPLPPLPAELENALYRIAAEALNNAVRHAQADQVHLHVDITGEVVGLAVCDNGRGLPPDPPVGIGLRSMTERAAELGGTLSITSPAGHGTTVHAYFPASQPRT